MGVFDFLKGPDINEGVRQYEAEDRAILIDAREKDEYESGHIKGSKNLPLSQFAKAESMFTDKSLPLYVYCHSGGRSKRMVVGLQKLGYNNVNDIGGIMDYTGKLER